VKEAELTEAEGFDVAVAIQDGEGVAVLEHAGAVIGESGRGLDVVFIFDADDICHRNSLPRISEILLSHRLQIY
jgi:hypothetical protein